MINDNDNFKITPKVPVNDLLNENDDDDDELSDDQLQILINQISFQGEPDSYPKRLDSLQTFANYLIDHTIPPVFMIHLHLLIFQLIQQESPPEINQAILSIIISTYDKFIKSDDNEDGYVDYEALVGYIMSFIPSEEAFEALALITSQYLDAAKIVVKEIDAILEWINDEVLIHNALILINALVRHEEIVSDLNPYINNFLVLSQNLDSDNLKVIYSILGCYTQTKQGLTSIEDYEMLGSLFDKAFEDTEIFYNALCFVEKVNNETRHPSLFMERANALDFFEKSLDSSDAKIFKAGLRLCNSVAVDEPGSQLMIENGTVDRLFNCLESSKKISNLALQTICRIVSSCSPELVPQFIEKDLMDIITLYLPVSDQKCQMEILKCIQTIIITLQQTGNTDTIQELATNELQEVLDDLMNGQSENRSSIEDIARYIYSFLYPID